MSATVKPGDIVRLVLVTKDNPELNLNGIVLTVAPPLPHLVGANGEPTLTVVYLDPKVPEFVCGSANWHVAFKRATKVVHASHEDVTSGRCGIWWTDVLDDKEIKAESRRLAQEVEHLREQLALANSQKGTGDPAAENKAQTSEETASVAENDGQPNAEPDKTSSVEGKSLVLSFLN